MKKVLGIAVGLLAPVLAPALAQLLLPEGLNQAIAQEEPVWNKPLPGRATIAAGKPDWCQGAQIPPTYTNFDSTYMAVSYLRRELEVGYGDKTMGELAQIACARPDDAKVQQYVAHYRQGWVNLIGTTDAEDRANMKVRAKADHWAKEQSSFCDSLRVSDEASLEEQSINTAMRRGLGCNNNAPSALGVFADASNSELGWWLDKRAEIPSEILRTVFVTQCIRVIQGSNQDWPDAQSTWVMQAFGTCGVDARRMNKEKLEKELADPRFNDYARVHARELWSQAKVTYDYLDEKYKALAAKDEAYKRLLYDAPTQGFTNWENAYAANKDAYEAALSYEDKYYGPSKKALKNCGTTLRKNFNEYLKSKAPKDAQAAHAAALDSVGGVLLMSLTLCDGVEQRYVAARAESELLREGPVQRGPRHAAYGAALAALADIVSDRDKFPVKPVNFSLRIQMPDKSLRQAGADSFANKTLFMKDPQGTLSGVAKSANGVKVSFKTAVTMVWNTTCVPNKRVLRVELGGQVTYDKDCHTNGKIPIKDTIEPLEINAAFADGLKLGQTVIFAGDENNNDRTAFPMQVYGDKEMKKLVVYYGAQL